MENEKMKFEVKITDLETGEEKYKGLTDCIFLACNEGSGVRIIQLNNCNVYTEALCYRASRDAVSNYISNEPGLSSFINIMDGIDKANKEIHKEMNK